MPINFSTYGQVSDPAVKRLGRRTRTWKTQSFDFRENRPKAIRNGLPPDKPYHWAPKRLCSCGLILPRNPMIEHWAESGHVPATTE